MRPELKGFTKAAGWPLILGAAGLVGAGAVVGAKAQKALGRGKILDPEAFKAQVRQKSLERTGSFSGTY